MASEDDIFVPVNLYLINGNKYIASRLVLIALYGML